MSIQTIEISSQFVASIRKDQPPNHLGSFISSSAISLLAYLKEVKIDLAGRGFTIKHTSGGDNVDIEVCLPVVKTGQDRGDIKFREVKGGKAASITITGPYHLISGGYDALQKWLDENKHKLIEVREIFIKGPTETSDTSKYVTEIQYIYG